MPAGELFKKLERVITTLRKFIFALNRCANLAQIGNKWESNPMQYQPLVMSLKDWFKHHFPRQTCLFDVENEDVRVCRMRSKLTIKTPEQGH